jgi:hypothetical protein
MLTVNSARLPEAGFVEIAALKEHHMTVGNPTVGQRVIVTVKAAQPIYGFQ